MIPFIDENSVSTAIREGINIIMERVDRLYVKKCEIKRLEADEYCTGESSRGGE